MLIYYYEEREIYGLQLLTKLMISMMKEENIMKIKYYSNEERESNEKIQKMMCSMCDK